MQGSCPSPPPPHCPPSPRPRQEREKADPSQLPKNGSPEDPLYYETLESGVLFDAHALQIPAYVARRRLAAGAAAAAAAGAARPAAGGEPA